MEVKIWWRRGNGLVGRYSRELTAVEAIVEMGGDPAMLADTADILMAADKLRLPWCTTTSGPTVVLTSRGWAVAMYDGHGPRHTDRPPTILDTEASREMLRRLAGAP